MGCEESHDHVLVVEDGGQLGHIWGKVAQTNAPSIYPLLEALQNPHYLGHFLSGLSGSDLDTVISGSDPKYPSITCIENCSLRGRLLLDSFNTKIDTF